MKTICDDCGCEFNSPDEGTISSPDEGCSWNLIYRCDICTIAAGDEIP